MKTTLLLLYLFLLCTSLWLKCLNLKHLRQHGQQVPPEFDGAIDLDTLRRTSAYTVETTRLDIVVSLFNNILVILFLFGGVVIIYDDWINSVTESFVGGGVLFFLGLVYVETLLGIPFSLYKNFGIENRYGFNTMTGRLWFSDLVKSLTISSILLALLISVALALVRISPNYWWLWVWSFFLISSIFLVYISPYLIEPLFFKFEPVRQEGLEDEIRRLVERAGLRVSHVFQVDASRRSKHSNAYFSGFGRVKRIVLFDTLFETMKPREILAVLAHELGHWQQRHILKKIVLTEAIALAGIFLAYKALAWDGLPSLVNLPQSSFYVRIAIVGFLGALLTFPLTPLMAFISRRHEREADQYACRLTGRSQDLAEALTKLSKENLTNLHPHPYYAAFYYSHPPVAERVRRLLEGVSIQRQENSV